MKSMSIKMSSAQMLAAISSSNKTIIEFREAGNPINKIIIDKSYNNLDLILTIEQENQEHDRR